MLTQRTRFPYAVSRWVIASGDDPDTQAGPGKGVVCGRFQRRSVLAYKYKRIRLGPSVTIDEYRLVMQRHLRRELSPDEIVHHKNEDPRDNRVSNLELTNRAEHCRHHRTGIPLSSATKQKLSAAKAGKRPVTAPLSDETVRAIRIARLAAGPSAVARQFGILKVTVIQICNKQRYAYVA